MRTIIGTYILSLPAKSRMILIKINRCTNKQKQIRRNKQLQNIQINKHKFLR